MVAENKKWYTNVITHSYTHKESGLLLSRVYHVRVKSTQKEIHDRLKKMCEKNDLYMSSHSSMYNKENDMYICRLKCFFNVQDLAAYLRKKFKDKKYSLKIKGNFALLMVGDNKYFYRIIPNTENTKKS